MSVVVAVIHAMEFSIVIILTAKGLLLFSGFLLVVFLLCERSSPFALGGRGFESAGDHVLAIGRSGFVDAGRGAGGSCTARRVVHGDVRASPRGLD